MRHWLALRLYPGFNRCKTATLLAYTVHPSRLQDKQVASSHLPPLQMQQMRE